MKTLLFPAPDFSAPDSESISSDTTLLTEPRVTSGQNTDLDPSVTAFKSPSRQLAGISLINYGI